MAELLERALLASHCSQGRHSGKTTTDSAGEYLPVGHGEQSVPAKPAAHLHAQSRKGNAVLVLLLTFSVLAWQPPQRTPHGYFTEPSVFHSTVCTENGGQSPAVAAGKELVGSITLFRSSSVVSRMTSVPWAKYARC